MNEYIMGIVYSQLLLKQHLMPAAAAYIHMQTGVPPCYSCATGQTLDFIRPECACTPKSLDQSKCCDCGHEFNSACCCANQHCNACHAWGHTQTDNNCIDWSL